MIVWGGVGPLSTGGVYTILPSSLECAATASPFSGVVPLAVSFSATATPSGCTPGTITFLRVPGDCNGSGTVTIGEIQGAINMFLGLIPPACGVDCNGDGVVSIGEVQKVINVFLGLTTSC